MIHDIFKTSIYGTKLEIDNNKLETFLLLQKDEGNQFSNIGGYQSKNLTAYPEQLLDELNKHINTYSDELNLKKELSITNMWYNINEYKDYNISHRHPLSIISGVYYVKTPKDCGNIKFLNPVLNMIETYWHDVNIDNNLYSSHMWEYIAEKGVLYLFPSFLQHYVMPNLNKNEERISISFNAR